MNIIDYIKNGEKILSQMPGVITIVDTEHRIVWANNKAFESYGFQAIEQIIGKKHTDMKCKACERADITEKNEKIVFTRGKTQTFISYQHYASGWKFGLCEKSPLINDEGLIMGLINYCTDISNYALVDVSRFIFNAVKIHGPNNQFGYHLEDESSNQYQLSMRQLECLFFLLRGKSVKEIAKYLQLSPRTVEDYIQEIKIKMQCLKRTHIIEKAISEGLLNKLPKSFLENNIANIALFN